MDEIQEIVKNLTGEDIFEVKWLRNLTSINARSLGTLQ